jgi:hypothetical protein
LHKLGHKAWNTVQFSLGVATLNQDVLSFDVTELSHSLLEWLDTSAGTVGIAG